MSSNNDTTKIEHGFCPAVRGSHVVLGLALFLAANILFWTFQPLAKVDPESLPAAHTWVWWATRQYMEQQNAPQVVLVGSSLMMHPVSRLDADFLNHDLDYVHHHQSQYMDRALSQSLGLGEANCFNFALPGSMISDDYIIARALFQGQRKPNVVVLGLSLRDFVDAGVTCPAATPAFRYLKRFTPIDDIVNIAMPQIWQRFDYYVGKAVYLWDKKLDIQVVLAEWLKHKLNPAVASICAPSLIEKADPEKNMPSNLRSEIEENMFIVEAHQPYSWQDNSAEYRKRYRNGALFAVQAGFLNKLLDYLKAQDIQAIIVNMPLTGQNMALMQPGSYDNYLAVLKEASSSRHCLLLDLNSSREFGKTDFYDTSHMNSAGGRKLIDKLVAAIASHRQLADALTGAAKQQLAARKNVPL